MIARQVYTLRSGPGGRITGQCWTNDDEDTGYPSTEARWPVSYPSEAEALRQTGATHVGISGVEVEVSIDGRRRYPAA